MRLPLAGERPERRLGWRKSYHLRMTVCGVIMKIISRDDAISSNSRFYFTGKKCKRGHLSERHVSSRNCVQCKKDDDINRAKIRAAKKGEIVPPFNGVEISRKDALSSGFKYYFTKKECKNGHVAFRDVTNSNCVHCMATREMSDEDKKLAIIRAAKWSKSNRERSREIKRNWVKNNPEKANQVRIESYKKRNKKRRELSESRDPHYVSGLFFHSIVRRSIKSTGKKKTLKTCECLGYDISALRKRIEFQFKDGMSWSNYGEWHIDHKKPIARFMRQGIHDPAVINALSNLQPLWAKDNLRKSDKWIY
jgi:plasmid stability protein